MESNVIHTTFNKSDLTIQNIITAIQEKQFDKLVLIGTKEDKLYTTFVGLEDVVEILGMMELVKLNIAIGKE